MNYIGCKNKLSEFIKENIIKTVGDDLSNKIFCDMFAGTGIVGRIFKNKVKKVISNDIEYYSYVLNRNYIGNTKKIEYNSYINELNNLELITNGFIYSNYCYGSGSNRQYFNDENGIIIDTIRTTIENWKDDNVISEDAYYFLLASLIESSDKIANTASVYGAFLKQIKTSASKKMILEPAVFETSSNTHEVYNEDSNWLIDKIEGDILYLDPPYNERQYGANYHLLNTIAKYDYFTPIGKTGLRTYFRSNYCKKQEVENSLEYLIKNAKFKYIFLSYNNEGLLSENTLQNIMNKYGKYTYIKKEYQRFKADKTENRNHTAERTFEYLHILEK
jgi:adenine-specific DNA-methyltransferase